MIGYDVPGPSNIQSVMKCTFFFNLLVVPASIQFTTWLTRKIWIFL